MKTATLLPVLASTAAAATIRIDVGKSGLTFSPESVTAQQGDVLEYHFFGPIPHSVAVSEFDAPCNPISEGGFYSGMIRTQGETENENVFRVTVNSTDTIWYYCGVPGHCPGGMVGVVNPPSEGENTLDAYKEAATSAEVSSPPEVFGGVVGPAESDDDSTSSTTTSPPSPSGTSTQTTGTPAPTQSGNSNGNGAGSLGASVVGVLGAMVGVAVLMI